ncbi:hypothetical protein ABZV75_08710 [Streptomyces flaveolus]|uniref:hypothetical protein n=1 Tax=Streptomyces flaveolus TaxID=67297 RepID=UPI0033B1FF31
MRRRRQGDETTFTGGARGHDVALQRDGELVAAGSGGGDWALARYNANGSWTPDWTVTGGHRLHPPGVSDHPRDVVVQADGRIVAPGSREVPGPGPLPAPDAAAR